MPDIIDAAQAAEAKFLQGALAAVGCGHVDDEDCPEMIDGVACCVECARPIPLARREAVPGAGRGFCKQGEEWP